MSLNVPDEKPAYLLSQGPEAVQEAGPEVLKKWTVNLLQTVFGAGVHTDIQLGDWHKAPGKSRTYGGEMTVGIIMNLGGI